MRSSIPVTYSIVCVPMHLLAAGAAAGFLCRYLSWHYLTRISHTLPVWYLMGCADCECGLGGVKWTVFMCTVWLHAPRWLDLYSFRWECAGAVSVHL